MSDHTEYTGSASEAEEDRDDMNPTSPRSNASRSSTESPREAAQPKRIVVPRRPKLDAERVLDNRNGITKLTENFRALKFRGKGHEVADLDTFIRGFEDWASVLYPYGQNILDFARTVENELGPQRVRGRLLDLRQNYVRELVKKPTGPAEIPANAHTGGITQEELMRKKEENRRKALEKLKERQMQKQKNAEQQAAHQQTEEKLNAQPGEEIDIDVEN